MRSSIIAAALFAAIASASIPGLPSCAQGCVGTDFGGCGSLNVTCICSNHDLISGLACCVSKSCDSADQATVISFADSLCQGNGVSDLPKSATCASTASSSSTGTSSATSSAATTTGSAASSVSSALAGAGSTASSAGTSATGSSSSAASSSASATTSSTAASSSASASASATGNAASRIETAAFGIGALVFGALAAL